MRPFGRIKILRKERVGELFRPFDVLLLIKVIKGSLKEKSHISIRQ